jgi:hypothetical protein
VNRSYYDVIHEKYINERDAFIERLSHDCIVVQTLRVDSARYDTNLDKLLSVFELKKEKEDKQRIIIEKDMVIAEKKAALIREQEEKAVLLAELNALRNKK